MATSPKAVKPGPKPVSSSDSAPSTAAGSRKKLFIIGGAALLLAAGGGAWYVMGPGAQHKANGAPAKAEVRPAAPPVFLALENFTVNLQSEEMQQFLQVAITLQVADDAQVELIKTNMPQVRNRLLLLLSGKKAAEILSVEGKKKLSAEIMEQLKQPFTPQGPRPEVSEVFFTSFVVQ
ncbi:MAG TPA: flagellar basal body-associated protein FliL [Noviherbaspirillum sp.]|nr:flagellar basal body-associated protein FliL [Noviherbaspirillum sp.]